MKGSISIGLSHIKMIFIYIINVIIKIKTFLYEIND